MHDTSCGVSADLRIELWTSSRMNCEANTLVHAGLTSRAFGGPPMPHSFLLLAPKTIHPRGCLCCVLWYSPLPRTAYVSSMHYCHNLCPDVPESQSLGRCHLCMTSIVPTVCATQRILIGIFINVFPLEADPYESYRICSSDV